MTSPIQMSRTVTAARAQSTVVPRHVALILDGNRRWARARGLSIGEGHNRGLRTAPVVLGWCDAEGIEVVTLWMLSVDNLRRRHDELRPLFGALAATIRLVADTGRWPVGHLGDVTILPPILADAISDAIDRTRTIHGMRVNLAIGYDGRQDIVQAVRRLVSSALAEHTTPEQLLARISEQTMSEQISGGQPDPDLIIRTSGETRLSGFMTWQGCKSELFFTPTLWPDFSREDLHEAITAYRARDRRYGK